MFLGAINHPVFCGLFNPRRWKPLVFLLFYYYQDTKITLQPRLDLQQESLTFIFILVQPWRMLHWHNFFLIYVDVFRQLCDLWVRQGPSYHYMLIYLLLFANWTCNFSSLFHSTGISLVSASSASRGLSPRQQMVSDIYEIYQGDNVHVQINSTAALLY